MIGAMAMLSAWAAPWPESSPKTPTDQVAGPTASTAIRLLYPPDGAVVLAETVQVIAIAPAFRADLVMTLDGQPIKLSRLRLSESWLRSSGKARSSAAGKSTQTGSASVNPAVGKRDEVVLLARITLAPGKHLIEAAGVKANLFRSTAPDHSDAPAQWPRFHTHPSAGKAQDSVSCQDCHPVQSLQPNPLLERAKVPQSCHTCHDLVDLRLIHAHVMDPLSDCRACHDPHGTTRPSLLTHRKDKLCTQCHEAGHSAN